MECIISVWLDMTHMDGVLLCPDATGGWAVSVDVIDRDNDDLNTACEIVRTFPGDSEQSHQHAIELAFLLAHDAGRRVLGTDHRGERVCLYDPAAYQTN